MKRFYKLVSVGGGQAQGFTVDLDGRPVKTPAGGPLRIRTRPLAEAVAAEWAAQGETVDSGTMPLMQLCVTAAAHVPQDRAAMTARVLVYLDTDLLCYRSGDPGGPGAAQARAWDPPLAWFARAYGVPLQVTDGLAALKQPQAAHDAVRRAVEDMDDPRFTVLQALTALSGSLVLALAFVAGETGPDRLFDAIHVEDMHKAAIYNEAFYGAAPHEEKKRVAIRRDLEAAEKFLDLLGR